MVELDTLFPKQVVLNGADYFLLQLDQIMLRSSEKHNVCTFVVALQDQLEHQDLELSLLSNPAYQWITCLRIKRKLPFLLSKWAVDNKAAIPKIKLHQLTENQSIPETMLASGIQVERQAPFKIDLLQTPNAGSKLIFTWHHSLMDAHGGESFIRYLGLLQSSKEPEWLQTQQANLPLAQRARIAHNMKDFLHDVSRLPLLSLYEKKVDNPALQYKVMSFTAQQSQLIAERAKQHGTGFLLSSFYLAATACAVAYIKQRRAPIDGDVLVPVPLDRRRRGSDEPVIGNQVSFLFYRIPKQTLSDLQACTTEIMQQMKGLMLSEKPDQGVIMMDFMRRVPGSLYRLLIKQPTAGLMASFFFSDTGETLLNSDQLFGKAINSAIHYPPTMYPPGMTFVFSRFRGSLNITFGYMEEVINDDEVEQLFMQLRTALLSESSASR
jgi:NRPS condensation-like uncharacterized protein